MEDSNNLEIMYFHGVTTDNYKFTIAGIVDKTVDDDLLMGIAVCSDKDNFNKAKGRTIATGRVLNQRSNAVGRTRHNFYSMVNEYKTIGGFPENYFVGKEIKIFRNVALKYTLLTKKELLREFSGLHKY